MGHVDSSFVASIIEMATNFGALGVIFWLFVTGKLHSDDDYRQIREDFDAERKAHEMTRQALSLANARAESSQLTGQLVLRALYPQQSSAVQEALKADEAGL